MDRELAEFTIEAVKARSEAALQLGVLLSIAVAVEPGLLRAMRYRLAPDLDAGAESDFWFSDLIESRSATAVTFERDVVVLLREQLRASGQLDAARSVIAEVHTNTPATIQAEEEIIWRTLRDAGGDAEAVEQLLRRAVKTMVDTPHRAHDIARWADRALRGLPESAHDPESARLLAAGSYLRIGSRARMAGQHDRMVLPKAPQWLAPSATTTFATVGVRLLEVGLEFVAAGTEGSAMIAVPTDELRLVQLEWMGPDGDQVAIAEARVGNTVALPAYVASVKLRTMAGMVYRVEAETGAELHHAESAENAEEVRDEGETQDGEEPSDALGGETSGADGSSNATLEKYRVAKVLVVGDDTQAKLSLFWLVSGRAGRSMDDTSPAPQAWRMPEGSDDITRDVVFWHVPSEPTWIGALAAASAAAIIVVDSVDTGKRPEAWLDAAAGWVASNPLNPPVILVGAAGGVRSPARAARFMQGLEAIAKPRDLASPQLVHTRDTDDIEPFRQEMLRQIDWGKQPSFESSDTVEFLESLLATQADRAGLVRDDAVAATVKQAFPESGDPREMARRAMMVLGIRGAMRAMYWPATDPHHLILADRYQETVQAFVRELEAPESKLPVIMHRDSDGSGSESSLKSLVMDEFVERGVGFQGRTGSTRWLVVPGAALDGVILDPASDDRLHFDCVGVPSLPVLWFSLLVELQLQDCEVTHATARAAEVTHLSPSEGESPQAFLLTLEANWSDGSNPTVRLGARPGATSGAVRRFGDRVEAVLRKVAGESVSVSVRDARPDTTGIRVYISVAGADRGRAFTRFTSMLASLLPRDGHESVTIQLADDAIPNQADDVPYKQADLFVAIISPAFFGSVFCMQELSAAAAEELRPFVLAPIIWHNTPMDIELLNRFQPFVLAHETGRTLLELCEKGSDAELKTGLASYVAFIRQRLDAGDRGDPVPVSEGEPQEWKFVPNTTTRETARRLLAAQVMQRLAMAFHVGSLHPSQRFEETEFFRSRDAAEQEDLLHARYVAEYVYAQDVTKTLQDGTDPFRPTRAEVFDMVREDNPAFTTPEAGRVANRELLEVLRDKTTYLPLARERLARVLGMSVEAVIEALSSGEPKALERAGFISGQLQEPEFVALARDILAPGRNAFLRFSTRLDEAETFDSYIEQLDRVLVTFAEWAAVAHSDERVLLYDTTGADTLRICPNIDLRQEPDRRGVSISVHDYPAAIRQASEIIADGLRAALAVPPGPTKFFK